MAELHQNSGQSLASCPPDGPHTEFILGKVTSALLSLTDLRAKLGRDRAPSKGRHARWEYAAVREGHFEGTKLSRVVFLLVFFSTRVV